MELLLFWLGQNIFEDQDFVSTKFIVAITCCEPHSCENTSVCYKKKAMLNIDWLDIS